MLENLSPSGLICHSNFSAGGHDEIEQFIVPTDPENASAFDDNFAVGTSTV